MEEVAHPRLQHRYLHKARHNDGSNAQGASLAGRNSMLRNQICHLPAVPIPGGSPGAAGGRNEVAPGPVDTAVGGGRKAVV